MLITIVSSYISYKVKRKVNNSDEKDKEKFHRLHEEVPKKPKAVKKKHRPKSPHPEVRKPSHTSGQKPAERKAPQKTEKPEHKHTPKIKEGSPFSKRINVVNSMPNTPPPPKQKEEKPEPKKKKINFNTLGDDILNKYADSNDDDFHSLNATKDE